VLVVKGFNSRWDGITYKWVRGDHLIRRFSYRGLDGAGRPRTYERDDTHRGLLRLAREMRRQVGALRAETGEPVSIVAESEGALVAQVYLAAYPRAPVDAVVLLSPLAEPGRVFYPPAGDDGWGVGAGVVMRGLAGVIGALGPVDVSADADLFRSIVDLGPTVGALLACPPPGIRSYAVLPVDEGVAAPAPIDVGYDHQSVGAFHGGLLGDATTAEAIQAVLAGKEPNAGSSFWQAAADTLSATAAAWQAPSLGPDLEPAWHDQPTTSCADIRATLQQRVREGAP
jgi:pimeloyl-ACP methyl ester carboxylesterase